MTLIAKKKIFYKTMYEKIKFYTMLHINKYISIHNGNIQTQNFMQTYDLYNLT